MRRPNCRPAVRELLVELLEVRWQGLIGEPQTLPCYIAVLKESLSVIAIAGLSCLRLAGVAGVPVHALLRAGA